jgi:hypothetical protein
MAKYEYQRISGRGQLSNWDAAAISEVCCPGEPRWLLAERLQAVSDGQSSGVSEIEAGAAGEEF